MLVNIFDINLISADWTVGGGADVAVPEPSTIVLGLLAGVALLVRRRQ